METLTETFTASRMELLTTDSSKSGALRIQNALARYADAARGAYAKNTERARLADSRVWADWCIQNGLSALPASPETVINFIENQASEMGGKKAPATIARYIQTIAHMHGAAELETPTRSPLVALALRRMRREKGTAQDQAEPLRAANIRPIIKAAQEAAAPAKGKPDTKAARLSRLQAARDAALIALAYASAMRRSELVALDWADMDLTGDVYGFGGVTIRRSKSDQEGKGQQRGIPPDVMQALRAWRDATPDSAGAVFISPRSGERLDGRDVARIIQSRASAAGMQGAAFSGHSTRRGVTMDLVEAGQSTEQIKQITGHKSDAMIARYAAGMNARGNARRAFEKIGPIAE